HLAVSNHEVAVTAKPLQVLVLVDVLVVGVQEVPVAEDEVKDWILVAVRLLRVATEYVVDCSAVVEACRHLTVGIETGVPSRVCESLEFIPFGILHQPEIWVAVATTNLEVELRLVQPLC